MNVQYWEGGAIASCTLLFSQESGVMNTGSGLWPRSGWPEDQLDQSCRILRTGSCAWVRNLHYQYYVSLTKKIKSAPILPEGIHKGRRYFLDDTSPLWLA